MRPRVSRRDAEAFAVAVDARARNRAARESSDRLAELVEVVDLIRSTPAPSADSGFVADLRAELMAAAQEELAPAASTPAPASAPQHRLDSPPRLRRRLAAAASSFVVIGGSFGLVAASAQAVPGDMLYPVKRATEKFELMIRDGAAEGRALLDHAQTRLSELESLTSDPGPNADDLISQTLADFTAEANAGGALLLDAYREDGSADQIGQLRAFTADSARRLEALAVALPPSAASAFTDATRTVSGLDANAYQACPTCANGQPIVSVTPDLVAEVTDVLDSDRSSDQPNRSNAVTKDRTAAQQPLGGLDLPLPTDPTKPPAEDPTDGPSSGPDADGDSVTDPVTDPVDKLDDTLDGDKDSPGPVKQLTRPVEDLTQPLTDTVDGLLSELLGGQ